jgi:quinol monooxygenase YgiN
MENDMSQMNLRRLPAFAFTLIGAITMTTFFALADQTPPVIVAPDGATPVIVLLDMEAKDPDAFKAHLLEVIPVTREASGARFSWSTQDPENPARFTLVQEWDSLAQQQGYIAWRDSTGDLAEFVEFLVAPPTIDVRAVFDQ